MNKQLTALIEKDFEKYGEFKGVVTMKKLTYQIAQKYAEEERKKVIEEVKDRLVGAIVVDDILSELK